MRILKHRLFELITKKQLREGRRITISDVSRETGLTRQAIYNWLNNPRMAHIDTDMAEALCSYLECEVGDLFYLSEDDEVTND